MFQPFKGQGSVEAMQDMWEQGIKEAKEYMTVPVVNEVDGSVALDPVTPEMCWNRKLKCLIPSLSKEW